MCVQSGEIATGAIMSAQYTTRETWLNRFTDFQRPCFGMYGHPIPEKLRIACGWPVGNVKQILGQCWSPEVSEDGTVEIFVNPMISNPRNIAEVVVHELCHAAVGVQYGHKGPFKRLAKSVGLGGPMRNTYAGRELTERPTPERRETRQDVAREILEKINKLTEAMQGIPDEGWDEVLGKGAGEFFDEPWAEAILYGIVNGIDYDIWNPATDPLIPAHYVPTDLTGKQENKQTLREVFGLPVLSDDTPIVGMVSRLVSQKGFDLLAASIDTIAAMDMQTFTCTPASTSALGDDAGIIGAARNFMVERGG